MTDIKYMDIGEFQSLGFLQEANRQFFHPHGLALEIHTVTTDETDCGSWTNIGVREDDLVILARLVEKAQAEGMDVGQLSEAIAGGVKREVGDKWIGGVWDYRDDPEGITFGLGGYGDSYQRAVVVAEERARHHDERCRLFGDRDKVGSQHGIPTQGGDVEPLDWVYPDATAQDDDAA